MEAIKTKPEFRADENAFAEVTIAFSALEQIIANNPEVVATAFRYKTHQELISSASRIARTNNTPIAKTMHTLQKIFYNDYDQEVDFDPETDSIARSIREKGPEAGVRIRRVAVLATRWALWYSRTKQDTKELEAA